MDLQKRISIVLSKLEGFPDKDNRDVIELLENNEWGVAFEVICSVIEQDKLSIDIELYRDIEEIGNYMEMDDDLWVALNPIK
ncbi:MAG: MafI family immunity protein [Bacillota bacterium]|nr:MafI family immunity protein [Bacillota bacterium]MDW7661858.1 MafI family immunity protein [Bacillota bacterium]